MRTKIVLVVVVLFVTITAIPKSISDETEFNYDNYLSSLDIQKYDETVGTDEYGSINVQVESRTEVDLHIEFKGNYTWGHWTFSSKNVAVEPGARAPFHRLRSICVESQVVP